MPYTTHLEPDITKTLNAWDRWDSLACEAVDWGWEDYQIAKYTPNPQDSWREIDKYTKALHEALAKEMD